MVIQKQKVYRTVLYVLKSFICIITKTKRILSFILVLTSIIYLHKKSSLYACNARPPNYFIILNKEIEKHTELAIILVI